MRLTRPRLAKSQSFLFRLFAWLSAGRLHPASQHPNAAAFLLLLSGLRRKIVHPMWSACAPGRAALPPNWSSPLSHPVGQHLAAVEPPPLASSQKSFPGLPPSSSAMGRKLVFAVSGAPQRPPSELLSGLEL